MSAAPIYRDSTTKVQSAVRRGAPSGLAGSRKVSAEHAASGVQRAAGEPSGIVAYAIGVPRPSQWVDPNNGWVVQNEWGEVDFDTLTNTTQIRWSVPGTYSVSVNFWAEIPAGEYLTCQLACWDDPTLDLYAFDQVTVDGTWAGPAMAAFQTGASGYIELDFICSVPANDSSYAIHDLQVSIARIG